MTREPEAYRSTNGLRNLDVPSPNGEHENIGRRRQRIDRVFVKLTAADPEGLDAQVMKLRKYGVTSRREGSRGADSPIPIIESGPFEGSVKDAFDRKLREQERIYDDALTDLEAAVSALLAVERFLLVPLSKEKARQALIDESAGEYRWQCYGCDEIISRRRDRPRNMRCRACHDWWVANGRPDTNSEAGTGKTPPAIIAARIERRSRRQAGR